MPLGMGTGKPGFPEVYGEGFSGGLRPPGPPGEQVYGEPGFPGLF